MDEIGDTRSSARKDEHDRLIDKFLDQGYEIESEETEKEEGTDHEKVSNTVITVLAPPRAELPFVKFEAKEIFGKYDFMEETYEPYDFPIMKIRTFTKGSDLKSHGDPWDQFDIG